MQRQRADAAEADNAERQRADGERQRADAAEAGSQMRSGQADAAEAEKHAERQTVEALRAAEEKMRVEREAAEALLVRAGQGVLEFQAQFAKQIAAYKSERAWRIMLAIRKTTRCWSGGDSVEFYLPAVSIGSALGTGNTNLDEFEPGFAEITEFCPRRRIVFAANGAPSAKGAARVQLPKADGHYDVIVLPIFDFDFRFQRPQQIAMQFASAGIAYSGSVLAACSPPLFAGTLRTVPIRENVWEIRLRAAPFDMYRGGFDPAVADSFLSSLEHLNSDLDLGASCVILQFPFWRQIGSGVARGLRRQSGLRLHGRLAELADRALPGAFSLAEERKLVRRERRPGGHLTRLARSSRCRGHRSQADSQRRGFRILP